MNLIFLPATEPLDEKYGIIPDQVSGIPEAKIFPIDFPRLVWYNEEVQAETIRQITAAKMKNIVLIGFSKSGLGAWNISQKIPELVSATLIFDSPMSRKALPNWGTAPFYDDDSSWQNDLPINSVSTFCSTMSPSHRLVLISSSSFHDEMNEVSKALDQKNFPHTFLPRQNLKHHWNTGWVEEGLSLLKSST